MKLTGRTSYCVASARRTSKRLASPDILGVSSGATFAIITTGANENFPPELVEGFDQLVATGNRYAIQLAVNGLMTAYQNQNGMEGEMLTGKGTAQQADVFRSQAEVIQAMNDPRYDSDPAYRQDIFNKLDRSDLNTY